MNSGDKGMPVVIAEPESASAKAFNTITKKIINTIENDQAYLEAQKKKAEETQ